MPLYEKLSTISNVITEPLCCQVKLPQYLSSFNTAKSAPIKGHFECL